MPFTGSYADHVALAYALTDYRVAERCARAYGGQFDAIADRAHHKLTKAAILCGHDLGSPSETTLSFSEKRVATFNNTFGKAA